MDDLDGVLARIDAALVEGGVSHEALAEGEPDPFPWDDAARWSPAVSTGEVEGWAVDLDPRLAAWYRAWDTANPPWVIQPATAEDDMREWA